MQNQILLEKAFGMVTLYGEKATKKTEDKQLLAIINNLLKFREDVKNNLERVPIPQSLWF